MFNSCHLYRPHDEEHNRSELVCDYSLIGDDEFDYLITYKSDNYFPQSSASDAPCKTSDVFNEFVDEGVRKLKLDNGRLSFKIFKHTQFKRFEYCVCFLV